MPDFRFINPITVFPIFGPAITIDKTIRLSEKYSNKITEHPVEASAPISDHKILQPSRITFIGEFSDFPVSNLVGSVGGFLGLSKIKFDALLALSVLPITFPVMDGMHLFKSMQFESLDLIKEDDNFTIKFQAELKQVRKVGAIAGTSAALALAESTVVRAAYLIPAIAASGVMSTDALDPTGIVG